MIDWIVGKSLWYCFWLLCLLSIWAMYLYVCNLVDPLLYSMASGTRSVWIRAKNGFWLYTSRKHYHTLDATPCMPLTFKAHLNRHNYWYWFYIVCNLLYFVNSEPHSGTYLGGDKFSSELPCQVVLDCIGASRGH